MEGEEPTRRQAKTVLQKLQIPQRNPHKQQQPPVAVAAAASPPQEQEETVLFRVHVKNNRIQLPNVPLVAHKRVTYKFTISNVSNYDIDVKLDSDLNNNNKSANTTPSATIAPISNMTPTAVLQNASSLVISNASPLVISNTPPQTTASNAPPQTITSNGPPQTTASNAPLLVASSEAGQIELLSSVGLPPVPPSVGLATGTTSITENETFQRPIVFHLADQYGDDMGSSGDSRISFFENQLFYLTNLVDSFVLRAKESREVVLAFLPSDRSPVRHKPHSKIHHSFVPVKGVILIQASVIGFNQSKKFRPKQQAPRLQQKSCVEFLTNVCKSFMETNVQELDFGDCICGQKYIKDFTVWNRSEIPLVFHLTTKNCALGAFEFSKYETGEMISGPIEIPGYSHVEISVTFKPQKIGEVDWPIYLENILDSTNSSVIQLRSQIVSGMQEDDLVISDERELIVRSLDFGDCYSGSKRSKTLTILNSASEPLDVFFTSDGGTVHFELKTELDNESQDEHKFEKIEELLIPSGDERKIRVWYRPDIYENSTELMEQKFRLMLKCLDAKKSQRKYTKTIQCVARVCTSLVEVSSQKINFGDSPIGSVKFAVVQLTNKSELPARIAVRFLSKIITCKTEEAVIPPKQLMELKFRLSPRRVNPNYRKQITIVNLDNPLNESIIEVQSVNTDKNKLMLHSLFYDVQTSHMHNFAKSLDFDNVVLNHISIRSFFIKNIYKKALKLQITTSSPKELTAYLIGKVKQSSGAAHAKAQEYFNSKEQFLEKIEKRSTKKKEAKSLTLDFKQLTLHSGASLSELQFYLRTLTSSFESYIKDMPVEEGSDNEQIFVRYVHELRKSLEKAISDELLVPLTSLSLLPEQEIEIFLVFKPSSDVRSFNSSTLKKIEEKLSIQLLDTSSLQEDLPDKEEIPPREIIIQAKICPSLLGITQRHINFGTMLITEEKEKNIYITNMSEVPLFYRIIKTGSVASSDLKIDSSMIAIVRPYGNRELHLLFKPSFAGKFEETIRIENIQDPADSKVITIKADIMQLERFTLKSSELANFGTIMCNQWSERRRIILTNMTKHRRIFGVRNEVTRMKGCSIEFEYDLQLCSETAETDKLEAELEKTEHKLRIAIRKQKNDKVKKLSKKVVEIKKLLSFGNDEDSQIGTSGEDTEEREKRFEKTELGIQFAIPGKTTQIIHVAIRAIVNPTVSAIEIETGSGSFVISENKNQDFEKRISFDFVVQYASPNSEQWQQLLQAASIEDTSIIMANDSIVPASKEHAQETKNQLPPSSTLPSDVHLNVFPTEIDLGRVSVGEPITAQITIQNISASYTCGFVILSPTEKPNEASPVKFKFSKRNAVLSKKEKVTIYITCELQTIGPQRYTISVQNLVTKQIHTVLIACNPTAPPPVSFPGLSNSTNQLLALGYCYVDNKKKYALVHQFTVLNKKNEFLTLDITSNTPNQIKIFQDVSLSQPAHNVKLMPHAEFHCFICLTPYLSPQAIEIGQCRILSAGIKIKVSDEKHVVVLYERSIPVKAYVGYSILHCSAKMIDFGCTTQLGKTFSGMFTLSNKNQHLPLEFAMEIPSQIKLSPLKGRLEPMGNEKRSSKTIKFTMTAKQYGLNNAVIIIKNLMCTEKELQINVRIFVDDKVLQTGLKKNQAGIDCLKFEHLYVTLPPSEPTKSVVYISQTEQELIKSLQEFGVTSDQMVSTVEDLSTVNAVTLKNTGNSPMTLVPQADMNLEVITPASLQVLDMEQRKNLTDTLSNSCGIPFILAPQQETHLYVILKSLPDNNSQHVESFKLRKMVTFYGTLMINHVDIAVPRVVKIIDVTAQVCVSEGTLLASSVNVGKFGYTTSWRNKNFEFKLRNLSEMPLSLVTNLEHDDIELLGYQKGEIIRIDPLVTSTFKGLLRTNMFERLKPGTIYRYIGFKNMYNSQNDMNLTVTGELTTRIWRTNNLQEDQSILLPMLEVPPRPDYAPCDKSFCIGNTSNNPITVKFEVNTDYTFKAILKLDLLNFATNIPLKEHKFAPQMPLDMRIRCTALADASISRKLLEHISKQQKQEDQKHQPQAQQIDSSGSTPTIRFGELRMIGLDQPIEVFPIYGSLAQVPTFSLSIGRLIFYTSHQSSVNSRLFSETFAIKNIKQKEALHFIIEPRVPAQSRFSLTVVPVRGVIEAGGSILVNTFLDLADFPLDESFPTENVFLIISDTHAPLASETVGVKLNYSPIEEPETPGTTAFMQPHFSHQHQSTLPSSSTLKKPRLVIKGCTLISQDQNRFEINIGQQSFKSSKPVKWDLSLENPNTSTPVSYAIKTISQESGGWLKLSQNEGTLLNDTHIITLNFSTSELGVFSTYLLVENLHNAKDMSIIRVHMEVVLSGKESGEKFFTVLVDDLPIAQNPVLDMGEVFMGSMVRHRYIDICNLTQDKALEFQIQLNHLPDGSSLPLLSQSVSTPSSTSNNGGISQQLLHQQQQQHSPVQQQLVGMDSITVIKEMYLSLSFTSFKGFHSLTIEPQTSARVFVLYKPLQLSHQSPASGDNSLVQHYKDDAELYVRCRLVKDYQQVVKVRAQCLLPQMSISSSELNFIGEVADKDKYQPKSAELTIKNLMEEPLKYEVRSDFCLCFSVITPKKCIISGKNTHTLTVLPVMSQIQKTSDWLHNKSVEEHFTIYNRKNLREKWWIMVRFTLSSLSLQIFPTPGTKSGVIFSSLEERILLFLSEFSSQVDRNVSFFMRNKEEEQQPQRPEDMEGELLAIFQKRSFLRLYFDLHYLTDELVFYALKGKVGQTFFDLAKLLYCALLNHRIFGLISSNGDKPIPQIPQLIKQWGGQLTHFLSYFPHRREVKMLAELHEKVVVSKKM